ncbi:hypothetical protein CH272_18330 [Rhodococcus sp. 05-340-1]|nr:hypothetical protein CH254_14480 [Rhodococcus sp. 06-412-2C]OZC96412.1 hypothetical protein CH279_14650 [Rhodococcus sp. 06-412-2B]OZD65395.1 hypothetical protein CH271_20465 [Rhodococcus sp. 05-340-2]OZD74559.1 hypothetical protein CH272_18330 [Rhodococcus sp. 05-340-1]OZD86669.1 hypothetical protein CH273_00700 [Rhodococcus sp. 05-339-2]
MPLVNNGLVVSTGVSGVRCGDAFEFEYDGNVAMPVSLGYEVWWSCDDRFPPAAITDGTAAALYAASPSESLTFSVKTTYPLGTVWALPVWS